MVDIAKKSSVVLVGMPGAGKSTLGVLLAKAMAKEFVDTDLVIQTKMGQTLQQILQERGYLGLREIEGNVLCQCNYPNHVVATGGSAVYSAEGMEHIKRFGLVVFLDVPLEELKRRIHNYETRGIAMRPEQSFQSLYDERRKLYLHYADQVLDCASLTQEQCLEKIQELQQS